MPYTKPYLSVQQQIALLQGRGMVIADSQKADRCLQRIGYYRLSGYWFPFRQVGAAGTPLETFKPNTSFDTVVSLYYFDKNLRLMMLDAIERVEVALRVRTSLLVGQRSPFAHRDPQTFDGTFSRRRSRKTGLVPHQDWLSRIDTAFARSREDFAERFRKRYPGDDPPIWISCETWDFGNLSVLFSGLTKSDQRTLAQQFGIPDGATMESWLRTINVARNACAHHNRVWNRTVFQPRWPAAAAVPDLAHIAGDVHALTRAYVVLVQLRFMLRSINPATDWGNRLKSLIAQFPFDPSLSLSSAGFPPNWLTESLWL